MKPIHRMLLLPLIVLSWLLVAGAVAVMLLASENQVERERSGFEEWSVHTSAWLRGDLHEAHTIPGIALLVVFAFGVSAAVLLIWKVTRSHVRRA